MINIETVKNVKGGAVMMQGKELVMNVVNKLQKELDDKTAVWSELTMDDMLAGKALDKALIIMERVDDSDSFEYVAESICIPSEELDVVDSIEMTAYHVDELRPTIMKYNDGKITYASPYHVGECDAVGSAYRYNIDEDDYFYLLQMKQGDKTYYELYLTHDDCLECEDEDEQYVVLRECSPVCSSVDIVMKHKLEELYNTVEKLCLYSKISARSERVLNEWLDE